MVGGKGHDVTVHVDERLDNGADEVVRGWDTRVDSVVIIHVGLIQFVP